MLIARLIAILLAGLSLGNAALFQFSGAIDPATNPNLTSWDQFTNTYVPPISGPADQDRAYNIAVHTFVVTGPGLTTFDSLGYGQGGFDAVLSIFEGTGNSASYIHHGFGPAPGDFSFDLILGPGIYTLAVSMFLNEPCASGFCFLNGEFADGFTNLVNFDAARSQPLFYEVAVTTEGAGPAPVPEPSQFMLLVCGITAGLVGQRIRARRRPTSL
jgi:hypothetical protein